MTRTPLLRPLAVAFLVALAPSAVSQSSQDLVLSSTAGQLVHIAPGGGAGSASTYVQPGFSPVGVVGDGSGTLFVTAGGADVYRVAPGGVVTTLATGFSGAHGLAFGPDGGLYVSDFFAGTVSRVDPSSGSVAPFATGFGHPGGLAFDGSGRLYVANGGDGTVRKVAAGGGGNAVFSTGYAASGVVRGLAFDPAGNLYATSVNPSAAAQDGVYKVGSAGGTATQIVTLGHAFGVAFDEHGDLYASADNSVLRYNSSGTFLGFYAADADRIQGAGYMAFTPVPEPTAALLACAVVGGLTATRRASRRRG